MGSTHQDSVYETLGRGNFYDQLFVISVYILKEISNAYTLTTYKINDFREIFHSASSLSAYQLSNFPFFRSAEKYFSSEKYFCPA